MPDFKIIRNPTGEISQIETSLTGNDLLNNPKLNKGCAFTRAERKQLNLEGLLPLQVETLEQQIARMYIQFSEHRSNLGKNIYLNVLHDYNETLFYRLVSEHLEEMLPIIYTPTVGEAVERFSLQLRKSRGLYVSYPEKDLLETILENRLPEEVDLIVVTDGEAVLGIGDQGIGGINISSAKLMVYTLCAGIDPGRVLPISLDVGTNNASLLADPMYLGWRHERIHGEMYDDFIEKFVRAIKKKFPTVFLHWEDLGRDNARRILTRYQDELCTFNGDMQGTGAIALACVLAGAKASGNAFKDQQIVILGAGTAGVGIADQICSALQREGLSEKQAQKCFWLLDKDGLLLENNSNLLPFQKAFARSPDDIKNWKLQKINSISLFDVINNIKSTTLIGCSTSAGAFSEEIIKLMASKVEKPVIMPLSNPNSKAEATPEDLIHWTNAKAIIATGSPFPDVFYNERVYRVSQSNNAFAFPGIGLGAIAVKAKKLSDKMIWAATEQLSHCSPALKENSAPLLPKISESKQISYQIALAVAEQARREGLARIPDNVDLKTAINQILWEPKYYPFVKK
jgi:malate dehydrogenase (oxaloacetate-decarboxylating)